MKQLISILSIIILLSACDLKNQDPLLPNVTGKASEVVLVINGAQWDAELGKEFRRHLTAEVPALPQIEPVFNLVNIPYSAFSSIFKTHRNVILVKFTDEFDEPKMLVQENVWSKPQLVINVAAKNEAEMVKLLQEKGDMLVQRIIEKEKERYLLNYNKYPEMEIQYSLLQKFNANISIPKGYSLVTDTTNFAWARSEANNVLQGVLVYSYDLPEGDYLTTEYMLEQRDRYCKKFVPGSSRGSHLTTEHEFPPVRRDLIVKKEDVIEIRGLWKIKGDFMGGPFVSWTKIDTINNKAITAEGFVYAPQYNKRNYLRQQEAIISTLKIDVDWQKKN